MSSELRTLGTVLLCKLLSVITNHFNFISKFNRGLSEQWIKCENVRHHTEPMTDEESKITAVIEKERRRIYNQRHKCSWTSCNEMSIDSHVLQKNGFVSAIAEKRQVYEHEFYPFDEKKFHFKKKGVNQVFTFKGFCSLHDDLLFREIEKKSINFNDYKSNLRFAYRILAQEIVKKSNVIDLNKALIDKNIGDSSYLQQDIQEQRMGISDALFTQQKILENIENTNLNEFNIHIRKIKFLDICASGVYTFETTKEINEMPPEISSLPLTDIFLNILPVGQDTIVSFVYLNSNNLKCNNYISSKWELPEEKFIKFLSDVLLAQMENWIVSPILYERLKKDEKILADVTKIALQTDNERFEIEYNMFKSNTMPNK